MPKENIMKWYYHELGGHTHVRVFMNGGKCGELCFRNEEFQHLKALLTCTAFIEEHVNEDHYADPF